MTMDRSSRADRVLAGLFDELADARTPDYLEAAIERASSRPQRPSWTFPERWLPMADITQERAYTPRAPWRMIAVALLVLALIVGVLLVAGSQQRRLPAPFGPAANGVIPYAINGDIYVGDPVTGQSRLILGGDTTDVEPVFSRDGTQIAFQRQPDIGNGSFFRIMAMNADGTNVHAITPDPLASPNWWDWTPTGDIVASTSDQAIADVVTYDGAGIDPPKTLTSGIDVDVPVFRPPTGNEILFRGQVLDKVGLYVMNADGSDLHPLIPPATSGNLQYTLREPRYSPDGSQIAFPESDDATGTMRLYVMNADGTGRRELGADPNYWLTAWPIWSNDGTRIAVQRLRRTDPGVDMSAPYAIIDVKTGKVTETGPTPGCCRIDWAPDDSSILLLPESNGTRSNAMLLDPKGGPAKPLPWTDASYPNWQRIAH